MDVQTLAPVLVVDAIEPSLPFWTEGLGFEATAEVPSPEEDRLGFVILEGAGTQVMLQTRASLADDLPALAEEAARGPATLYVRVGGLEGLVEALEGLGAEVMVPLRTTFYGADEVYVRSPGGAIVGLAAFSGEDEAEEAGEDEGEP